MRRCLGRWTTAWKALQENKIARELRKASSYQLYWIDRITLEANPLFEVGSSFELGKVTLLIGRNDLGKSALCEWLSACAGNASDLERWGHTPNQIGVNLRIKLLTPDENEFSMSFQHYALNAEYAGKKVLDESHALRILYIHDRLKRQKFEDDLESQTA